MTKIHAQSVQGMVDAAGGVVLTGGGVALTSVQLAKFVALVAEYVTEPLVTCGGGPPGDPNGEIAQLHADLRDFLLHVVDMSKGDHYWDVVRGNAEALLRRDALKGPATGCKTPAGCRENGCLGWCDEHRPDPALKPDIAALQKRMAEDPGFAAQVTGDRPPTPVGWSDTDWLKHLEEIRQDQEVYHRGPLPETGWD